MKAWLLDKICSWCVALFDWWTPSPEERWEQMQELQEAKAELRQALIEAFGMDHLEGWLTRIEGK